MRIVDKQIKWIAHSPSMQLTRRLAEMERQVSIYPTLEKRRQTR